MKRDSQGRAAGLSPPDRECLTTLPWIFHGSATFLSPSAPRRRQECRRSIGQSATSIHSKCEISGLAGNHHGPAANFAGAASRRDGFTFALDRGVKPLLQSAGRSRHAFTLVEVLVALCIFAMAAVVLGASYVNVLTSYEVVARGVKVNEDFGFAREQVLREPDRAKLEQGGEFETSGGGRAKWSVEITSTNVPEVFSVAFTCEISGASLSDTTKRTQQFTLLRPTWVTDIPERDKLKEEMKARIYELQGKKPQ